MKFFNEKQTEFLKKILDDANEPTLITSKQTKPKKKHPNMKCFPLQQQFQVQIHNTNIQIKKKVIGNFFVAKERKENPHVSSLCHKAPSTDQARWKKKIYSKMTFD